MPQFQPYVRLLQRLPTPLKIAVVLLCLYLFMVGIRSMGDAFKLLGTTTAQDLFGKASNPFISLIIGILATTLVQSSSITTSTVVAMAASGFVSLDAGVYMVMGANVGTTVTNTIVSLGHITKTAEYKRAFAAATVHDFFNLIVLTVLFPLEYFTGFLKWMAHGLTDVVSGVGGAALPNPVKAVTGPTKDALKGFAGWLGELFSVSQGVVLLVLGLLLLFTMLVGLVKGLRTIMFERVSNLFDRVIFKTAGRSLVFGVFLTILVQSSSITTSLVVPLVGAGVLTVAQVFPYTMGANIGTTCTALIAALAVSGGDELQAAIGLEVALHHVMFNIVGVAMMWKLRQLPIAMAMGFAELAVRNRLIPLIYIITAFYVLPFLIILFF